MSSVTPVPDPFYKNAFGATEQFRLVEPSGKVGHAELRIGGTLISMVDEYPDYGCFSPASIGGTPVKFHLYVPDVDVAVARAENAGGTLVRPVRNEFYGDRTTTFADPFGYSWQLSSRVDRRCRPAVGPWLTPDDLLAGIELPALGYRCTEHVPSATAMHVVLAMSQ